MSDQQHNDSAPEHARRRGASPFPASGAHFGEEEREGAPEWLISFADMVLLMMGFFVILFAMNIADKSGADGAEAGVGSGIEWDEFVYEVRKAFNNPIPLDSSNPEEQRFIEAYLQKSQEQDGQSVPGSLDPGLEGDHDTVHTVRTSEYYGLGAVVSFNNDLSRLDEVSTRRIDELAERIRGMSSIIEVRGHATSAEAYRDPQQAVQLAFDRALTASRRLAEQGVRWERIRILSASDQDPLQALPQDAGTDRTNARVEILVVDEEAPSRVPTHPGVILNGDS